MCTYDCFINISPSLSVDELEYLTRSTPSHAYVQIVVYTARTHIYTRILQVVYYTSELAMTTTNRLYIYTHARIRFPTARMYSIISQRYGASHAENPTNGNRCCRSFRTTPPREGRLPAAVATYDKNKNTVSFRFSRLLFISLPVDGVVHAYEIS